MKTGLLLALAALVMAQEVTRGILPEEVLKARQQAAAAGQAHGPAPRYQAVTPGGMARPSAARQLGVTIWKLRPAAAGDTGARLLVQRENETAAWIPERVPSAAALRPGDRVRISIESPEPGCLYVIDRELYASGTRGAPYLIFPTLRTRGGDNQVKAGRLIDIPAQDDSPNFFTLQTSRADQTGEDLTVILAPRAIEGVQIGRTPLALSAAQAAKWESQWQRKADIFELTGGAGKPWTEAEQRAGADTSRLLTQTDPAPQTVYRVEAPPEAPIAVQVRLRYRAGGK